MDNYYGRYLNADELHAFIHAKPVERLKSPSDKSLRLVVYGLIVIGRRKMRPLYGGGGERDADTMRGHALLRVLNEKTDDAPLVVHVKGSGFTQRLDVHAPAAKLNKGRKSDNEPFHQFHEVWKPLIDRRTEFELCEMTGEEFTSRAWREAERLGDKAIAYGSQDAKRYDRYEILFTEGPSDEELNAITERLVGNLENAED